jgi:hypothetical protein
MLLDGAACITNLIRKDRHPAGLGNGHAPLSTIHLAD